MKPELSVIIPTYKRTESLEKLLDALLAQRGVSLEIIIVDQNQPSFLDTILAARDQVRRVMQAIPNASTARNAGYFASSAQTLLFIDDDLLPEADFCRKGLDILQQYAGISCFSPLVYNQQGKELALSQAMARRIQAFGDNPQVFSITDTISAALFFRREYYWKTGGFDPFLFEFARTAEDQEFFLRMRKRNLTLYYVPLVEVFHDEGVPGGCELRTEDYWITRDKCVRAWVYRRRIHHHPLGGLSVWDRLQLARSSFINRQILGSGIRDIMHNIALLKKAFGSSKAFLNDKLTYYRPAAEINHLAAGQNQ